jgi:hypothetical protein
VAENAIVLFPLPVQVKSVHRASVNVCQQGGEQNKTRQPRRFPPPLFPVQAGDQEHERADDEGQQQAAGFLQLRILSEKRAGHRRPAEDNRHRAQHDETNAQEPDPETLFFQGSAKP